MHIKKEKIMKLIAVSFMIFVLTAFAPPRPAPPNPHPETGSNNDEHEIYVYSLWRYAEFYAANLDEYIEWKPEVEIEYDQDPYFGFWDEMDCSTPECMYHSSHRRRNQEVTVNSMVGSDGWREADLVFFYGHNTQISPPFQAGMFNLWRPRKVISTIGPSPFPAKAHKFIVWDFDPGVTNVQWQVWGTCEDPFDPEKCEPYFYHRIPVIDASAENGYAVFYAYNPFTSVLIGQDFTSGNWVTENTWDQRLGDWHRGQLGSRDIEWIIAHGCNAVTVAEKHRGNNSITPTPLGVSAWGPSWSDLHMVLGHYYHVGASYTPNATMFAWLLKHGYPIKLSYFAIHNETCEPGYRAANMPSAIAKSPTSCCIFWNDNLVCPTGGCEGDYMHSETWLHPMPDMGRHSYYFSTSYMTCEDDGTVVHSVNSIDNLDLDAMEYAVTGEPARELVQGYSIPLRSSSYGFMEGTPRDLPRVMFSTPSTLELKERLQRAARAIIGQDTSQMQVEENDGSIWINLDEGVIAAVKDSGALAVYNHHGHNRDMSIVKGNQQAVNLALEQVAQSGLLDLVDGESLDVIGITATQYAGWLEGINDEFIPVLYETSAGERVNQYTSEYTVTFGRRYKGVPIIGSHLQVVLDAKGKMVGFFKNWRDIAGEGEKPIQLMSLNSIEADRSTSTGNNISIERRVCGYVEASVLGVHQDHAGIGCRYVYRDPQAAMDQLRSTWINAALDGTEALWGTPIPKERIPTDQYRPAVPDDD